MGSRARMQRWCTQTLTPLMEGPDPEMQEEAGNKKEISSWEVIREWFRTQKGLSANNFSMSLYGNIPAKRQDLRLLLGVLGCPLAPIPLVNHPIHHIRIKDIPIETSTAHYIIQQYLAASGCLKQQKCAKNMYATGSVKMIRCETEISSGKNVKSLGTRSGENGCFVLWQMMPGMWSLELVVGGNMVIAGSDGKTIWRHTSWLGTHAAKGPLRPLRRIIQDSHLTRVQTQKNFSVYWETTIGSSVGDYRDIDGVLIAHQGRSIATIFRFGELSLQHSRTRMEEIWRIDDVVFNVPGLSLDSFIPPADIFDDNLHSPSL
ncbi:uncharacterized protein LOC111287835 [Durio zibethinus]|uniref:Uncharacterized protein LOC111287835 n=1 Tax=Durio zibethinus TaxID=66656 RepID=A0A6P5Y1E0_DURZI|nr:uncharacterized protein LOC111287835 [Durio zibethinus]